VLSTKVAARMVFPKDQNPMTKLMIVVVGGEFRMNTAYIQYRNRDGGSPSIDQVFKDGDRKELDIRATAGRAIDYFSFKFPSTSVKGSPRVQIWGFEGTATPPSRPTPPPVQQAPAPSPPPPAASWDTRGWKLLGEQPVLPTKVAARMVFPKDQNPMTKLMIVVVGGEFHMNTAFIQYRNRDNGSPSIDQVFKDGDRKEIDIKATAGRGIEYFSFKFPSTSVKGSPRVQIWGFEGK